MPEQQHLQQRKKNKKKESEIEINIEGITLVDDEQDALITYEAFFKNDGYDIISFTAPFHFIEPYQKPFKF